LYTGERRVVHRRKEGCTQEKGGLYIGKQEECTVHRKEVVHRRQEGCTREKRRVVSRVSLIDMPLFPYVPFFRFAKPLS
jgi:hypothetical protein